MKFKGRDRISIIGAPLDMGAGTRGSRLGPEAIRLTGLEENIRNLGFEVQDLGDIDIINKPTDTVEKLRNYSLIKEAVEKIKDKVSNTIKNNEFPLILGGDHSIAIGTIKGVLENISELGLIYFDAHADINNSETSPSGNIHGMSIASALGIGSEELKNMAGDSYLKAENIAYIGLRDVDPGEVVTLRELGILTYTMEDIEEQGIEKVIKNALDHVSKNTDGIHISLDVDSIDPEYAKGTGLLIPGGLSIRECKYALEKAAERNVVSLEIVEVNPLFDIKNQTAELVNLLICAFLGRYKI